MLLKNIFLITCIIALSGTYAFSDPLTEATADTTQPPGTLTIHVSNYSCFQSLECLKEENPFINSNLDEIVFNPHRYEKYIVKGSSNNEDVYAIYDGRGDLVNATLRQRNIKLPSEIYEVLLSDSYSPWNIIGNELVVHNFDIKSMTYKVILSMNGEVKVEYFDRHGNIKSPLS